MWWITSLYVHHNWIKIIFEWIKAGNIVEVMFLSPRIKGLNFRPSEKKRWSLYAVKIKWKGINYFSGIDLTRDLLVDLEYADNIVLFGEDAD